MLVFAPQQPFQQSWKRPTQLQSLSGKAKATEAAVSQKTAFQFLTDVTFQMSNSSQKVQPKPVLYDPDYCMPILMCADC